MVDLAELLKNNRTIRVIGFDDAPFQRHSQEGASIAGIVCAGTRFEGMVWGKITPDGWDATAAILNLLLSKKFLPQLHVLLLDGIGFGGFNLVDLPQLTEQLQIPCIAVMRREPKLAAMTAAIARLPDSERRLELLNRAGTIHVFPPFVFQVCGTTPPLAAAVLQRLTDCGKVPEALRLAHLIGAAVVKGESSNSA